MLVKYLGCWATVLLGFASAQGQLVIDELFSTTWNYEKVVDYSNPHIVFEAGQPLTTSVNVTGNQPTEIGLEIFPRQIHQPVDHVGGGITDSSSIVFQAFKQAHPDDYWNLLRMLFSQDPTWINRGGAGMNTIRVPLGASDFGLTPYTFDDTYDGSEDRNFTLFTIEKAPKMIQTIKDIQSINPDLNIFTAPWSAPGWMKENYQTSQPLFGGNLKPGNEEVFAQYLTKVMVALSKEKGITPSALSIQNEPLLSMSNYPTMKIPAWQAAIVGNKVRKMLDKAGLSKIKLIAFDHNWDNTTYASSVFDLSNTGTWEGAAFHAYADDATAQQEFSNDYPDASVYMTEYTTITQYYNEPWPNLKRIARNLLVGSIRYQSRSVILWNIALQVDQDGFTTPSLPNVCRNCAAFVLLNPNATDGNATADFTGSSLRAMPSSEKQANNDGTKPKRGLVTRQLSVKNPKVENQAFSMQSNFYQRTSNYAAISHLSLAVRPRLAASKNYARRIGCSTTDDNFNGGRVLVQCLRLDNVVANDPSISRYFVILLNQNDHYETGTFQNVTLTVAFRGQVAKITTVPGLYTFSFLAPTDVETLKKTT